MTSASEKVKEKNEKRNEEGNDHVPFPPGFTRKIMDLSTLEGQNQLSDTKEEVAKMITYPQFGPIFFQIIADFFFGGNLMMGMNSFLGHLNRGMRSILNAISILTPISLEQRFVLFFFGIGFFILAYWRALNLGLVGSKEQQVLQNVTYEVPFFFN